MGGPLFFRSEMACKEWVSGSFPAVILRIRPLKTGTIAWDCIEWSLGMEAIWLSESFFLFQINLQSSYQTLR